jgi:hypothetical protein
MHSFWEQPVIVLRPSDDTWEFRGVAYLYGPEQMNLDISRAESFAIV